jgi:hypothetical protein
VTAVLESEAQVTFGGQSVGPGEEALMTLLCSGHGQLAEKLSRRVFDRGGGVGVFVGVDSDVINCGSYPLRCPRMAERRRTELGGAFKRAPIRSRHRSSEARRATRPFWPASPEATR